MLLVSISKAVEFLWALRLFPPTNTVRHEKAQNGLLIMAFKQLQQSINQSFIHCNKICRYCIVNENKIQKFLRIPMYFWPFSFFNGILFLFFSCRCLLKSIIRCWFSSLYKVYDCLYLPSSTIYTLGG